MSGTSAQLAKLSRPRLFRVLDRDRLFATLDAAHDRAALWIAGPPGAGKTSLAASYLNARRLPGVWYEVDAGDADPASLFHYLTLAAPKARSRRSEPLLALTPEYLIDLPGFTRRFFRTFFARLRRGAVVVFDNCNTVPADCPFNEILRDALGELPQGLRLILISRSDPPAALSRAEANGLIARVGWEELRLTAQELPAIVSAARKVDEPTLQMLQQQSGGWAVGLVLILEHMRTAGVVRAPLSRESEVSYQYHALFREFLRNRARTSFTREQLHNLRADTANALESAKKAGLGERVRFELASAKSFPGTDYDLVTVFDCLHDMGDPVGASAHVRQSLKKDGTWMIVEPFADGGFSSFRRATATPFNLIFEARA